MLYRDLTDYIKLKLNSVDYSIIGKLARVYKLEFIKDCIDKFPAYKAMHMTPKLRSIYLAGICRSQAQPTDYIDNNKLDLKDF